MTVTLLAACVKRPLLTDEQDSDGWESLQAYRGSEGTAPLILNSVLNGCDWSTSRHGRFTPENEGGYSLTRRLGGPQRRSGRFGEHERRTERIRRGKGEAKAIPGQALRVPGG